MLQKLKFLVSWLWEILEPTVKIFLTDMGRALLTAAMIAVQQAEDYYGAGKGDEKREFAWNVITETLHMQGFAATKRLINRAIELALGKLDS